MGTTPTPPPSTPTQIAGQQSAPSSSVPLGPAYTPAIGAKTNTLAVVSLALAIGSFFAHVLPVLGGSVVAVAAIGNRTYTRSRLPTVRWPRKNDAASIRARQQILGLDGLVTSVDLEPFRSGRLNEAAGLVPLRRA